MERPIRWRPGRPVKFEYRMGWGRDEVDACGVCEWGWDRVGCRRCGRGRNLRLRTRENVSEPLICVSRYCSYAGHHLRWLEPSIVPRRAPRDSTPSTARVKRTHLVTNQSVSLLIDCHQTVALM